MEKDSEILRMSLDKYKDKNGKKAKSLKFRIECFESFENMQSDIKRIIGSSESESKHT